MHTRPRACVCSPLLPDQSTPSRKIRIFKDKNADTGDAGAIGQAANTTTPIFPTELSTGAFMRRSSPRGKAASGEALC
jgi:hypothetical protein